jgi:hypothetical protein
VQIVYLDQNKWIELARTYHGVETDPELVAVLEFLRREGAAGNTVLPLSAVHYMELCKIGNPNKRARLGEVMWELSAGWTMAAYRRTVEKELDDALATRFPGRVKPRPFSLLGRGVGYAFNTKPLAFRVGQRDGIPLPDSVANTILKRVESRMDDIERSFLTGIGPRGETMPPQRYSGPESNFVKHLKLIHPRLSDASPENRERALYAIALMDISRPLFETLELHGISMDELHTRGVHGAMAFVEDLPSRRVEVHLHRQVLKNREYQAKANDLCDWAGLGRAAGYCDFLVCEKHFADLIQRDHFTARATVLTNIRELPGVASTARITV